jgi:hypothetical protein
MPSANVPVHLQEQVSVFGAIWAPPLPVVVNRVPQDRLPLKSLQRLESVNVHFHPVGFQHVLREVLCADMQGLATVSIGAKPHCVP